ncbi:hypothetical protein [Herbiconiux liangxiaofengii]|uniref:hypothetical protein n=1 Tax=Herbiconiux liangxiaofengii TaxID=3342795 RepID=UPI0035B84AA5
MPVNSSYQQRRAARLDDPTMEGLRNPRARRRLAAGLITLFAIEVAAFFTVHLMPLVVFIGIMVVVIIAGVLLLGALKASTRGVEELSPDVLDERQAQLRGEIFARSYWALGAASLIACILVVLMGQPWWPLDGVAAAVVPALLVQVVVTLPTFVTALRVRV